MRLKHVLRNKASAKPLSLSRQYPISLRYLIGNIENHQKVSIYVNNHCYAINLAPTITWRGPL
jgi:hypothetical protein